MYEKDEELVWLDAVFFSKPGGGAVVVVVVVGGGGGLTIWLKPGGGPAKATAFDDGCCGSTSLVAFFNSFLFCFLVDTTLKLFEADLKPRSVRVGNDADAIGSIVDARLGNSVSWFITTRCWDYK